MLGLTGSSHRALPFTKGGEQVDYPAYRKLIDAVMATAPRNHRQPLGQFSSLSDDERAKVRR